MVVGCSNSLSGGAFKHHSGWAPEAAIAAFMGTGPFMFSFMGTGPFMF